MIHIYLVTVAPCAIEGIKPSSTFMFYERHHQTSDTDLVHINNFTEKVHSATFINTMSIESCSNELLVMIARNLDGDSQALSSVTKASKKFYKLFEEFLYRELDFESREEVSIKQLLLTLVQREELGKYIKGIRLYHQSNLDTDSTSEPGNSGKERKDLEKSLRKHTETFDNRIVAIMARFDEAEYHAKQWSSGLVNRKNVDEATALILSMAEKVAHVEFEIEPYLRYTTCVLRTRPFKNLKEMGIGGHSGVIRAITLHPSMTTLNIYSTDADKIGGPTLGGFRPQDQPFTYLAPKEIAASLQTLSFFGFVDITPELLAGMVSSNRLTNLKKLAISRCGSRYVQVGYNMPILVRALEQYVPGLEVFEYRRNIRPITAVRFDTFHNLKKLRELSVDYGVFISSGDVPLLFEPETPEATPGLFPKSLEVFTLDSIDVRDVKLLLSMLRNEVDEGLILSKGPRSGALKDMLSGLPFKSLGLCVIIEFDKDGEPLGHQLGTEEIDLLRSAADELVEAGLTVEVYNAPHYYYKGYKLLVKPGWSAPVQPRNFLSDNWAPA